MAKSSVTECRYGAADRGQSSWTRKTWVLGPLCKMNQKQMVWLQTVRKTTATQILPETLRWLCHAFSLRFKTQLPHLGI